MIKSNPFPFAVPLSVLLTLVIFYYFPALRSQVDVHFLLLVAICLVFAELAVMAVLFLTAFGWLLFIYLF